MGYGLLRAFSLLLNGRFANSYSLVDVFHRAELLPDSRERFQLSLDRVASLTRRRLSPTWAKFTECWP
jgi:hypothetical protein